jgi:hypothetical protein
MELSSQARISSVDNKKGKCYNKNMKTIKKCPVCKSTDIEQEYAHQYKELRFGGEHHETLPIPDGSHCNDCGTRFSYDKGGICPLCNGRGEVELSTYQGMVCTRTMVSKCDHCKGKGKL